MQSKILVLIITIMASFEGRLLGQSYATVAMTSFVLNSCQYVASTNLTVGTNILVELVGYQSSANISGKSMTVTYNGGPATYPSGISVGYVAELYRFFRVNLQ